ncbi:MAG: 4-hydroxy-2-oxovalerate aldolase [Saprospiraceae bacterium]|nr:4-hydroxy-2-oxovalerate aldolase [Saprospiraceae bacterium]
MKHNLYIQDVSLRDGMHPIQHQYTRDQIKDIAIGLDKAKVDAIEISHGDGLCGGSFNYGFGAHTDWEWLEGIAELLNHAKLTTLLIPGIGKIEDLKRARDLGVESVRVATHSTEADISAQHIEAAREMGMDVSGFLMMAHMNDPKGLAEQAKLMESYGAHCVYVTDSAGALLMNEVRDRIKAFKDILRAETEIGIHCHHNLSFGVANTIVAMEEGANRLDASLAGMGAGAGNCPLEVLIAVLNKMKAEHNADLFQLMDMADDVIRPLQQRPVQVDRETLSLGYSGVYSSFLLHSERAAKKYGLDTRTILNELGRRKMVGGQEDMIIDVALDLVNSK